MARKSKPKIPCDKCKAPMPEEASTCEKCGTVYTFDDDDEPAAIHTFEAPDADEAAAFRAAATAAPTDVVEQAFTPPPAESPTNRFYWVSIDAWSSPNVAEEDPEHSFANVKAHRHALEFKIKATDRVGAAHRLNQALQTLVNNVFANDEEIDVQALIDNPFLRGRK